MHAQARSGSRAAQEARTSVNADRQAERGRDAGAGGVERQLGDGHAHGLHAQVPQRPHALAVRQADRLHTPLRPVLQDAVHAPCAPSHRFSGLPSDPLLARVCMGPTYAIVSQAYAQRAIGGQASILSRKMQYACTRDCQSWQPPGQGQGRIGQHPCRGC